MPIQIQGQFGNTDENNILPREVYNFETTYIFIKNGILKVRTYQRWPRSKQIFEF